jgi:hypothetical protein
MTSTSPLQVSDMKWNFREWSGEDVGVEGFGRGSDRTRKIGWNDPLAMGRRETRRL